MARSATMEPMLPQPITPSVLPNSSVPRNFDFSHLPAWVERSASGDLARQRHHQREGVLGSGDGVAEGRVHDDDALGGGGLGVDVVDADAGAPDHLQVGGSGDDLLRHLGGGADGQAIVGVDDLLQLVLGKADLDVGVSPRSLKAATAAGERLSAMRRGGPFDASLLRCAAPLPLVGRGWGCGETGHRYCSGDPPSLTLPHKGGRGPRG